RIMSYNRIAFTATAALVALPVGALLKYPSAYRVVFPIAAVVGMIGSFIYLQIENLYRDRWPPEPPRVPLRERLALASLWCSARKTGRFLSDTFRIFGEDAGYRWFALSVFTYGFGNLMIMPLIPIYQVDRLHISTAQIGLLAQVAQVTSIFAYFYWGRFVDLKSPLRGVVINVLLNACIPLIYFFSGSAWHLVPAFLLTGVTNAGIDLSYFNSILSFANEENVARYQALHSFLLGIRGTLAPFAGVAVMHLLEARGFDTKYLFLVGMVLILLGCWMQVKGMGAHYRGGQPR
ncbi:MAG: MFS transporter, partial [Armatimonadota bacterium]|nr:MFS transporter [Armatimonadota bacterium]